MDSTVITALVGAFATITASVITAIVTIRVKEKSNAESKGKPATSEPIGPTPVPTYDLTGIWKCDDDAVYYVRQLGRRIFWCGEKSPQSPSFCNVAFGVVSPTEVAIDWADIPKGKNRHFGTMVLQITDEGTGMKATRKTGKFGGSTWMRTPG